MFNVTDLDTGKVYSLDTLLDAVDFGDEYLDEYIVAQDGVVIPFDRIQRARQALNLMTK